MVNTIDFSTVEDGKAKASAVIAKSGTAIAAFHALEVLGSGSTFPSSADYVAEVKARLLKKAESAAAKYGEDSIV